MPLAPFLLLSCLQALSSPAAVGAESSGGVVRWAVIGDYGKDNQEEADVAELVRRFAPDFVLTTGDNNYPSGSALTIDANIGKHYASFIHPYLGAYGPGASTNRFWPSLGNHDWDGSLAQPYLDYFTLPGNERYYDVRLGAVHVFALDSDPREPDGITAMSAQAAWLASALSLSDAPWKVVTFHHPAYSSSLHGSTPELQWPFRELGVDVVLNGHDHDYERSVVGSLPYLVVGACGAPLYTIQTPIAGSQLRFDEEFGALFAETDDRATRFEFVTRDGTVIDTYVLPRAGLPLDRDVLVDRGAFWRFDDGGTFPGAAWTSSAFDDSAWQRGPAELGYGDGDEATVVSFGPSSTSKYITTWFRKTFTVAAPGVYSALDLALLRDDGAVVYLNGTEVHRSNMPGGIIGPTTLASTAVAGSAEQQFFAAVLPTTALVAGNNVLAVEIHQNLGNSSDLSFDCELSARRAGLSLVSFGSAWKYSDGALAPRPEWSAVDFDDAGWPSGAGEFGYGDGDETTLLDPGVDPTNVTPTVYFRREFDVPASAAFTALELSLLVDDGARVFLNGRDVGRWNLPKHGLTHAAYAGFERERPDEALALVTALDPRALIAGRNVIAVEVHQASPTSDDLSFDLELVAR